MLVIVIKEDIDFDQKEIQEKKMRDIVLCPFHVIYKMDSKSRGNTSNLSSVMYRVIHSISERKSSF